jgi:hypothetical protein
MRSHDPQSCITYRSRQIAVKEVAHRKLDPNTIGWSADNTETLLRGEDGIYYLRSVCGWNRPSFKRIAKNDSKFKKWRAMPATKRRFSEHMMLEFRADEAAIPIFRFKRISAKEAQRFIVRGRFASATAPDTVPP